jgi:transcriptional regulator with XRE-family HTH domain
MEEGERNGINQSKIADAIGVHRSVISRELNGRQDITLGRLAELAWAMGREIDFSLPLAEQTDGSNTPAIVPGALMGCPSAVTKKTVIFYKSETPAGRLEASTGKTISRYSTHVEMVTA